MVLSSIGLWRRVGTSEVSFAWGLCESLCLCLPHRTFSKLPLCVSVCEAATLWGQAPQGRGKVAVSSAPGLKGPFLSCLPHLTHPTRLCSPDCPGLCPAPHFYQHICKRTLCGSPPLWRPWCGKCGSELSLSIEFGPRKLKSKETWPMACNLNLWIQVVGDGRAGLRFQVSGACLGFGQEL